MLVELHLLTSHAPSNLNRDDLGQPKSALFGGVERGRISSQAQKRALRFAPPVVATHAPSTRSKRFPLHVHDAVAARVSPTTDDDRQRLVALCEFFGSAVGASRAVGANDPRKLMTEQAIMLSRDEVASAERVVEAHYRAGTDPAASDKKAEKAKAALLREIGLEKTPSDGLDLALFGRMTTDDGGAFSAVDAAMQVAHPIATHATDTQEDYFTAVDDLLKTGERGSAHLDTASFNSAVYYKYFSCDLGALAHNLSGTRAEAVEALVTVLDAACQVTPSGKQNSYASHSLADVALVVVRESLVPCSLANAFERAVPAGGAGYLAESTQRLAGRYARLVHGYGLPDRAAMFTVEPFEPALDGAAAETFGATVRPVDCLGGLWDFVREATGGSGEDPS